MCTWPLLSMCLCDLSLLCYSALQAWSPIHIFLWDSMWLTCYLRLHLRDFLIFKSQSNREVRICLARMRSIKSRSQSCWCTLVDPISLSWRLSLVACFLDPRTISSNRSAIFLIQRMCLSWAFDSMIFPSILSTLKIAQDLARWWLALV